MIISQAINYGSGLLKKNKIKSHLLDSELLLSNVLKKSREKLLISYEGQLSRNNINIFSKLIKRRLRNEPVAYIFKKKEFWSKDYLVNKNTLIPRPETELLIDKIVKNFKQKKNLNILDVGTGSGCILISLIDEIKNSRGIGIDISRKALKVASKNIRRFKLDKKIKLCNRSIDQVYDSKFDLVVSNPPYICSNQIKYLSKDVQKYEPRIALDGGNDGLDVIRKVIYKSRNILKRKGMLALEIGYGQYNKVSQILKLQGFKDKFLVKDYQNNIRCILTILEE